MSGQSQPWAYPPMRPVQQVPVKPRTPRRDVVLAVVACVVGAVVAVAAIAFSVHGHSEPAYRIGVPETAGGLSRDHATEAQLEPELAAKRKQYEDPEHAYTMVSAYYGDPQGTSAGVYPAGVMFIGGSGDLGGDYADEAIAGFKRAAGKVGGSITDVDPGPHGGRAACRLLPLQGGTVADCVWVTPTSFGYLVLATKDSTMDAAADVLLRIRPDVETRK